MKNMGAKQHLEKLGELLIEIDRTDIEIKRLNLIKEHVSNCSELKNLEEIKKTRNELWNEFIDLSHSLDTYQQGSK